MGNLVRIYNQSEKIVKTGQPAASFSLSDENGLNWSLKEQKGKVSVLLFYPKNETLVCTKQLCSVRDHWNDYLETKAEIVAVSSGSSAENKTFSGKYRLPIKLLSDADRKVTNLYCRNLIFPLSWTRGIVVIDAKGVIRFHKLMFRAFRPSDRNILAEIYKARTEALYESYKQIKKSFWKFNKNPENHF